MTPTNWQIAPAQHQLANYDKHKIDYRKKVEDIIAAVPKKSLKKKTFITISTNVLCADISTSKDKDLDPKFVDIYLPLEIALTKWNVSDANKPIGERTHKTKHWMLNPGRPTSGSFCQALDHKKKHWIEFDKFDIEQDNFLEPDLQLIMREINSFLLPDRTVYSINVSHCRQDVGCLKWLNLKTNRNCAPIMALSLEDLYVVLIRNLVADDGTRQSICQGLAKHRMEYSSERHELINQCQYHKDKASEDNSMSCDCCARALSVTYTDVLLNDVKLFTETL